jgi:hypothetical protein
MDSPQTTFTSQRVKHNPYSVRSESVERTICIP